MKSGRILIMPVLASVCASLIAIGAYLAFPVPGSPVPIVLQNLFVMLTALIMPMPWSLAAVLIYLGMGALGLPVFQGGTGGLARFAGPTGGFLTAYIPATAVMGLVALRGPRRLWKYALAAVLGIIIVYAIGLPWLRAVIGGGWMKAISAGFLPFIGWDALKAIVAVPIAYSLRPWLEEKLAERDVDA